MATTYEKIQSSTVTIAATSIDFTSIPSTYTDLRIVFTGNYTLASRLGLGFNSDSGTNYSYSRITGNGTAAASARGTSAAYILAGLTDISYLHTNNIDIFSYAGSTYKTCLINVSADNNGSGWELNEVALWRSTSAITSVNIKTYDGTTIAAGSTATLYGIKAA
jgi:hypothetical protein